MRFTIFGAGGLIGSQLVRYLVDRGHDVTAFDRRLPENNQYLGHVINCIGLTADFRRRPIETIEAHASLATRLLYGSSFESWLYLSSTRVYGGAVSGDTMSEESNILVRPSADAIYDLSKLLGEAACLGHEVPSVRVARLSNVYSPNQNNVAFLGSIVSELREQGVVTIREAPESSKDYIALDDVTHLLEQISLYGKHRLYNVASGVLVTHRQIAERLHRLTGKQIFFAPGATLRAFPRILISRVQAEFSFVPRTLLEDLPSLL